MKPILGFLLIICLVGCGRQDTLGPDFRPGCNSQLGADSPTGYQELTIQGYYKNGQIRSRGEGKNGREDGWWVYYYENGQIESEGFLSSIKQGSNILLSK